MPFFTFDQNNTGGSYDNSPHVGQYVIVEAESPATANTIVEAKALGVYFDGVADDMDCECCGDRWSRVSDSATGDEAPSIYGKLITAETVEDVKKSLSFSDGETVNFCVIYYSDGTMEIFE